MSVRVFVVLAFLISSVALAAERAVVSLDGEWDYCVTPADVKAPGADVTWSKVQVPGSGWVSPEGGSKAMWYRRNVEIPASAADGRVFVDLRAARYVPRVYVDGKMIGEGSDGWSPTVVEITEAVAPGKSHEVIVRCQDRGAFFVEGFVLQKGMTDEQTRGKTLAPVGGYKDSTGIADRVLLRITPRSYVDQDEVVIDTSVRKATLTVSGMVQGAAEGHALTLQVVDGDKVVLEFPAALRGDGSFEASSPFTARLWSPEDPHLYQLRFVLRDGAQVVDSYQQRFGFREVWTQGPDFYLNGVKRHLLGTSTWPGQAFEKPEVVRQRVKDILASNANTFRPHIGLWPEAWLDAADELGLMIIDESAVYTDGSGFYAYNDERFWANYRDHIAGMIKRDRNRASLVMWSLGNEILFMGNQRYDAKLPEKLGQLAEFARSVDPIHPLTFEADLDPDGKYDVIGLHYPLEMPQQREYPNAADWMGTRIDTEAGGGMLGQRSSRGFVWDRKKPLYIGEYLWVPHGDYSCSTIWFGDEAFLNRDVYHNLARVNSWYDQTIAYRRSGVSGMCPWTALEFAAVVDKSKPNYAMQQEFYTPVAAFWRTRGLRFGSGSLTPLAFDVFNDSPTPRTLELRISGEGISARHELKLEPADYAQVELPVKWPDVTQDREIEVVSELLTGGEVVHRVKKTVKVWPVQKIAAPEGWSLLVYDPSGSWQGSVKSLAELESADPEKTLLLVAQNVVEPAKADEIPVIGRTTSDIGAVSGWLARGGRAVILEQGSLGDFGIGIETAERASTMSFPLWKGHPLLKGLDADDLKYWAPDNYVTRNEIIRPSAGGGRAVTVTGGSDWLKFAPIAEVMHGKGMAVMIQMLAGERRDVEPAAARLINNALAHVTRRVEARSARIIGDERIGKVLAGMRLAQGDGGALVLSGGGEEVVAAGAQIRETLDKGGLVYWHAPTADAFAKLRQSLGATGLQIVGGKTGISLAARDSALFNGVSREDLTSTSRPGGWDRKMNLTPNAATGWLAPETQLDGAVLNGSRGEVLRETAGLYEVIVEGSAAGDAPVTLIVNDVESAWGTFTDGKWRTQAMLRQGANRLEVRARQARSITVSNLPALAGTVEVLAAPAAVARWQAGDGTVVIDTVNWLDGFGGPAEPKRFANALMANLGLEFTAPTQEGAMDVIALERLSVVGESPYMERSADRILARAAATLEAEYEVATPGEYVVRVHGSGTPCQGEYPRMRILVDGKEVGVLNTTAGDAPHSTPAFSLQRGKGKLRVIFDNDASQGDEDRNLTITRVGFAKR